MKTIHLPLKKDLENAGRHRSECGSMVNVAGKLQWCSFGCHHALAWNQGKIDRKPTCSMRRVVNLQMVCLPIKQFLQRYYFTGTENGLKGEYFNNTELSGNPLYTTTDKNVDVNWSNKAPREDMNDDNFGVRWSGELVPDKTAVYQLGFISTTNTRLYLNDSLVAKNHLPFPG